MEIAERIRPVLGARDDVRLAYLFGSVAAGTARPRSDADIGILFDPIPAPRELDLLSERLEAAVGRAVDLVVLNLAPPLLAREVIVHGRLILCRDDGDRVRLETRTTARYQDTAHLRRVQYSYLRERTGSHRACPR
jgi:predicted nucleotidyltransferase